MRGNILDYSIDDDVGVISGPDGIRYKFSLADWKHKCPVISGVNVDYVVVSGIATEIYCTDKEALDNYAEKISAEKFSEIERLEAASKKMEIENELSKINTIKQKYHSNYLSSDMALWKGVIAGYSHKVGFYPLLVRLHFFYIPILALIFVATGNVFANIILGITILIGIYKYLNVAKKWIALPTKDLEAKEYSRYIKAVNKDKQISSLNKIASFANEINEGLKEAEKTRVAKKKVFSNVISCKCGASGSTSSDNRIYGCPVCKSSFTIHYKEDGSISSTSQW